MYNQGSKCSRENRKNIPVRQIMLNIVQGSLKFKIYIYYYNPKNIFSNKNFDIMFRFMDFSISTPVYNAFLRIVLNVKFTKKKFSEDWMRNNKQNEKL